MLRVWGGQLLLVCLSFVSVYQCVLLSSDDVSALVLMYVHGFDLCPK